MSDLSPRTDPFLSRVITAIESHLEDENYGVAELADEMSMNRSTLLRRVRASADVSVAVFIRQVRLRHAKELLRDPSLTISEVAYQTGFSSSSYFAKCFREEYGYPPSEEVNQLVPEKAQVYEELRPAEPRVTRWGMMGLLGGAVLAVAVLLLLWFSSSKQAAPSPKTIAVLPFQNDSPDSSNVYLINGLMVAIIDNLHQIKDLQVTSRTTVERYRGVSRTIPELAEELGVSYFVEGSGQKRGDQILLTLRLIDGQADTLIWSRRYQQESTDIFQLQTEVSTSIAREIEVFITPEEQKRIELPPTENLLAYDYYLKGLEQIKEESREGLSLGISSFEKAIAEDPQFAHPYAYLAISYYFMDLFKADKSHVEDINTYADKALLLDPSLNESLIGKALYYMQVGQFEMAIQFFDKVLDQSPGYGWTHNLLSTIYNMHLPDTEQYLRHAIQGLPYAVAGQDSHTVSFTYLHVSNALAQNGFLAEADSFVKKAISYHAENLFAEMLSIYIQMGQDYDLERAYERFQVLLERDTSFLATLQELGKIAYYRGDYEAAWRYYSRFLELEEAVGMNVYPGADINIAYTLDKLGRSEEAATFEERYRQYLEGEESIYRDLGFAVYYAYIGELEQAMASYEAFAEQDGYQYWLVMFIDEEPIIEPLLDYPVYQAVMKRIRDKFWRQHRKMRAELEAEGVI
jgi:TolB-like protein/AraC-like DNA-binding protein/tetratricopeptide (TPR) repeat protein